MTDIKSSIKRIKETLIANAKAKDKAFFAMMVPGNHTAYGVKTPVMNELARKYSDGSFDLAEALWKEGSQEERVIAIKIMEKKGKTDPKRLLRLFGEFSATIDNWAVCDGLGMQFLRSIVKTHRDELFAIAKKYSRSANMWQRRLSLVMVEWYTRHSENHAEIKKLVASLQNDDEYYVKKAVVWINRNLEKGK